MDTFQHTIGTLFAQIGLPDNDQYIQKFIHEHRHLDDAIRLDQAPFWTSVQANFLKEAIDEDSDWAEVVDQLDACLRH
ncbi:MAG: DUF2789 domain-containing protein [Motiliproteus sp.]